MSSPLHLDLLLYFGKFENNLIECISEYFRFADIHRYTTLIGDIPIVANISNFSVTLKYCEMLRVEISLI